MHTIHSISKVWQMVFLQIVLAIPLKSSMVGEMQVLCLQLSVDHSDHFLEGDTLATLRDATDQTRDPVEGIGAQHCKGHTNLYKSLYNN